MTSDITVLTADVRSHLSERRFTHSLNVAAEAEKLAVKYGGDPEKAYLSGLVHDILKENDSSALRFFEERGITLTELEKSAPKLWHAMAGAVFISEHYDFEDDIITAVRYHTTGRENMSLLEKILFVADFISADRDYPGVDEMRKRAQVSLEYAMEEGLRFTINELSEAGRAIHPDTVACYNEIILRKDKNNGKA